MTIKRWITAIIAMFTGWMLVLMAVMAISDAAPSAMVLFAQSDFMGNLPDGAAIVSVGRFWVLLESETPGFTRALYEAGAWAVLPGGLFGCFGSTQT